MMEYNSFDLSLLEMLHIKLSADWFRSLMVFISSEIFFLVSGSLLLIFIALKYSRKCWPYLTGLLAAVGLNDAFSAHVLKPWFARLRPCQVFEEVRSLAGCAGLYSFPSNHASNTMAVAIFVLCLVSPRVGRALVYMALAVGLSRVVLGVHYPTDVLFGYCVGGSIGLVTARITKILISRSSNRLV